MTSTWAGKAGSALPVLVASAIIIETSSSCPPSPDLGADAASTALLWWSRTEGATPELPNPCIKAARPPVRTSIAVLTPARFSSLKRGSRFLKFFSLVFITFVFLATPAASPTPRLFTLKALGMRNCWSMPCTASPSDGWEAETTDLVPETSMQSAWMRVITSFVKPPSSFLIWSWSPACSHERSSTNRVGVTDQWTLAALSTMSIMTSRISDVASPDPATMPRTAHTRSDTAPPTRMTRGSL